MKRLLYVAYFFPPMGGAGVQRSAFFARHLPEFGWRPSILTADARYWMQDDSLQHDITGDLTVTRAPHWGSRWMRAGAGGEVRSASRMAGLRRVSRFFLLPDAYLGWVIPAYRLALRIVSEIRPDAILTTSSPDSAHLLGLALKQATGLPWVADFRDPWTRRLSYAPPTRWHDRAHRSMERRVLASADRVVLTSDETRDDFLARYAFLTAERVRTITNGYSEPDFQAAFSALAAARVNPFVPPPILHAGQLNPDRPLEPYLDGLAAYARRSALVPPTVFLGGSYDRDRQLVEERGLSAHVRFEPPRAHRESVAACLSARILLLLEQDTPNGELILPGKTLEYLRAGRPILAVVPPRGAAARLVRSLGAGRVADPAKPDEVAEAVAALVEATAGEAEGVRVAATPPPHALQYERRILAGSLAGVLNEISPSPRANNRTA